MNPLQNFQSNEFGLFYQSPNDNNFYHITCKMIIQDYPQNSENLSSLDDDDYDYEFFYQSSSDFSIRYHVTCKLLSYSLIINILNKEIYGRDFDTSDLKRKYLLTSHQKLNLELNLRQILPYYLYISGERMDEGTSSFVNQNYWSYNDYTSSYQDENEAENYTLHCQQ